jgi:hypothetical protein
MNLPYSAELFIDREEEIALLLNTASSLTKGKLDPNQRILYLIGRSHIGKSWLLQKYCDVLSRDSNIFSPIYVGLENYASLTSDDFLMGLLKIIDEIVSSELDMDSPFLNSTSTAENYSKEDYSRWVSRGVEQLQREKTVVLLLDEVGMLSRDQMMILEDKLLVPIIYLPKVVLVLTGRSAVTGWKDFALRPRRDFNYRELSSFNYEKTELQIAREKPAFKPLVKKIFDMSGGSPGNNKRILDQILDDSLQINELDAIRACNQELYDSVSEANNGLPENLSVELLPALEALCVLQDFDKEYEMPELLAAHKNVGGVWDVKRSAALFSILANIQIGPGKLIDWDSGKSAYAIEEQTRANLERELELRDKDLWTTLHCTAMNMYAQWAKDFEEYDSEVFRIKAEYHRTRLEQAGFDPTGCEMKD